MDDIVNYLQSPEVYKKELYKAFKRIFAGTIKESFLVNMVDTIEKDPRYIVIFMNCNNPQKMLSLESTVTGGGFKSASICKMIVMSHYFNTVSLNDYERGKQQTSKTYKDKLTDEVLNMLAIEKIAASDCSNISLESYLPLVYYISGLTNYCCNKYEELSDQKSLVSQPYDTEFNYRMIYKLLIKIKACIALSDIRAVDELNIIFRSLIELFMTYAILWDQDKCIIDSFYKYDSLAFDYNLGKEMPDDVKLLAKDMGADKVKFLNYGWIKNIKEFNVIKNKSHAFGIGGLAKILDKKCAYFCENFGSDLQRLYKACNPQTHGTILMMNYLEIELHIFQNIAVMLKFISDIMSNYLFKFDFNYNGVDLISRLNTVLDASRKIYEWLQKDQKNLDKTNIDYRNRAICSLRMK